MTNKKNGKFIAMGIGGAVLAIGSAIGAFLNNREQDACGEPDAVESGSFEESENDEAPAEEMGDPE